MATDPVVLQYLKDLGEGINSLGDKLDGHAKETRDMLGIQGRRISDIELSRANENGERRADARSAKKQAAWLAIGFSSIIPLVIEFFTRGK